MFYSRCICVLLAATLVFSFPLSCYAATGVDAPLPPDDVAGGSVGEPVAPGDGGAAVPVEPLPVPDDATPVDPLPDPPAEVAPPSEPALPVDPDNPPAVEPSPDAPLVDDTPNEKPDGGDGDDGTIDPFGSLGYGVLGIVADRIAEIAVWAKDWGDTINLFNAQKYAAVTAHVSTYIFKALLAADGNHVGASAASANNRLVYNGNSAAWLLYQIKQQVSYSANATHWTNDFLGGTLYVWLQYAVRNLETEGHGAAWYLWYAKEYLSSINNYVFRLLNRMEYNGVGIAYYVYESSFYAKSSRDILNDIRNRDSFNGSTSAYYAYRTSFYAESIRSILSSMRTNDTFQGLTSAYYNYLSSFYSERIADDVMDMKNRLALKFEPALNSTNVFLNNIFGLLRYDNKTIAYYVASADSKLSKLIDAIGKIGGTGGAAADLTTTNNLISAVGMMLQNLFVDRDTGGSYPALLYDNALSVSASLDGLCVSFSDYVTWLDGRLDDVSFGDVAIGDVVVDLSGVESRLDSIATLLALESAIDLVELFIGDFDLDIANAAMEGLGAAMETKFPFCIPSLMRDVIRQLESESSLPMFQLTIYDASAELDFGFLDITYLAEATRWACRIFFLCVLLANTRKFLFTLEARRE